MEKICFKSEERTAKKKKEKKGGGGGVSAFSSKLYFLKNLSQNNTYTLEFLKIAFPSIRSPNLQL